MSLVVQILMIADNLLVKYLIDYGNDYLAGNILAKEVLSIFAVALGIFFAAVIIRSTIRFFQMHVRNRLMANVRENVRTKYFNKIIDLDYEFHTDNKSGELISKLDRGSAGCVSLTELITLRLFSPIFAMIVVLFSIGVFYPIAALVTIGTSVFILVLSWKIFDVQVKSKLTQDKYKDKESGFVSNVISGFESIKFFCKEDFIKKEYSSYSKKSKDSFVKFNDYYRVYNVLLSAALGIGTILILWFSLRGFVLGEITIGTVVLIFTVFGRVISPIVGLSDSLRNFNESLSDIHALFAYNKKKNSIKDLADAKDLEVKSGAIEFKDLSFRYKNKNSRKIFDDFNLKISEGESVAIVGSSGSGKTSLVKLLFRLYNPSSGKILIDNQDISKVRQKSLRNQISVVPQETILFNDTIYNNLKFSNNKAKKGDVEKVLKLSYSNYFISKFPNGVNTVVGERGVKLSGGEKQRISIARALLADKKIIVLDEPTSSLDLETEDKIQKAIDNLLKNKTAIIIAHRLSTIKNVDRIVVLKDGKIVEQGKHRDLLRKKGEYFKLWEYQKHHKDEEVIEQ